MLTMAAVLVLHCTAGTTITIPSRIPSQRYPYGEVEDRRLRQELAYVVGAERGRGLHRLHITEVVSKVG